MTKILQLLLASTLSSGFSVDTSEKHNSVLVYSLWLWRDFDFDITSRMFLSAILGPTHGVVGSSLSRVAIAVTWRERKHRQSRLLEILINESARGYYISLYVTMLLVADFSGRYITDCLMFDEYMTWIWFLIFNLLKEFQAVRIKHLLLSFSRHMIFYVTYDMICFLVKDFDRLYCSDDCQVYFAGLLDICPEAKEHHFAAGRSPWHHCRGHLEWHAQETPSAPYRCFGDNLRIITVSLYPF